MATKLSKEQARILSVLTAAGKGKEINLLCGERIAGMNKEFRALDRTTHAALRGLEARGLISAEYFWRGATVTLL